MNIDWSFHAQDQLAAILRSIAFDESYENAVRILAILNTRQLITEPDTIWDK